MSKVIDTHATVARLVQCQLFDVDWKWKLLALYFAYVKIEGVNFYRRTNLETLLYR